MLVGLLLVVSTLFMSCHVMAEVFPASIALSDQTILSGGSSVGASVGGGDQSAIDFNGDHLADIIVGDPDVTVSALVNAGASYILMGLASRASSSVSSAADNTNGFQYSTSTLGWHEGRSTAYVGDLNGDKYGDFVSAAPSANPGGSISGTTSVIWGKAGSTWSKLTKSSAGTTYLPPPSTSGAVDAVGNSLSAVGDFNGDGYNDFLIGTASTMAGHDYGILVWGKSGDWGTSLTLSTSSTCVKFYAESLTVKVGGLGDVNGDGLPDAGFCNPTLSSNTGKCWIVFGTKTSLTGSITLNTYIADSSFGFSVSGPSSGSWFGDSIQGCGDVNGDSIDDFAIGADGGKGNVYVIYGTKTWASTTFDLASIADLSTGFVIAGETSNHYLGSALSHGDVNGDYVSDIIIGAYGGYRAYVVYGKRATWSAASYLISSLADGVSGFLMTGASSGQAGKSVSFAGDTNGDKFGDLLVGAPDDSKAYLVLGRGVLNCHTLSGTTCTRCLAGFKLSSGACVACDSGTWSDGTTATCTSCTHCQTCTASKGCTLCSPGYGLNTPSCTDCGTTSWSTGSTVCQTCANCQTCSPTGGCSLCSVGYGLSQGKCVVCTGNTWSNGLTTCGSGPENCITAITTTGGCSKCTAGYGINAAGGCSACVGATYSRGSTGCVAGPDGCATVSHETGVCLKCASGYGIKSGACTVCADGYWSYGNTTCIKGTSPSGYTGAAKTSSSGSSSILPYIIGGAVAAVACLLLIVGLIVLAVVWRRKKNNAKQNEQAMPNSSVSPMPNVEMNVAPAGAADMASMSAYTASPQMFSPSVPSQQPQSQQPEQPELLPPENLADSMPAQSATGPAADQNSTGSDLASPSDNL